MFTLRECRPARVSGQRCLDCMDADMLRLADRDVHTVYMPTC